MDFSAYSAVCRREQPGMVVRLLGSTELLPPSVRLWDGPVNILCRRDGICNWIEPVRCARQLRSRGNTRPGFRFAATHVVRFSVPRAIGFRRGVLPVARYTGDGPRRAHHGVVSLLF